MAKKTIASKWTRFGIQNHIGGVWTPETFESHDDAECWWRHN